MSLVADSEGVAAVAEAVARATLVAFDLEFLSQDRLVPTLCLVQVSWIHERLDAPEEVIVATVPEVALVDPLAVDVAPLVRALAAHPRAVAHAARQDLGLLATRFSIAMPNIADTQVMAAFAGLGEQVGLANLANELLGLSLGKEQQWTAWDARPLSPAQLVYADADVRYLPTIYKKLVARLGPRLAWALAESSLVAGEATAAAAVTPETAWEHVGGVRGLDVLGIATAMQLAAWRLRVCTELDKPLGQLVNDRTLLDLARHRPASDAAVKATKGLSRPASARAADIVAAIAAARASDAPPRTLSRPMSTRAQRWSEVLLAIAHMVTDQTGVASRLLATRGDAEELARAIDEGGLAAAAALPAFASWRRELLGEPFAGWLRGDVALVGDLGSPHGMRLVRYDQQPKAGQDQPTQ